MNVEQTRERSERVTGADVTVDVRFDRSTRVTTGRARSHVKAPISELARALDPIMWQRSPFFVESFKVVRRDGHYERDQEQPVPGSGWRGLLFEHFRWAIGPFEICRFVNILKIDFQVTSGRVDLRYSLHRPVSGRAWFSPRPLGVDVDSGYVTATQTASGIDIDLVKSVRAVELGRSDRLLAHAGFFSAFLNNYLPVSLRFWLRLATMPWASQAGPN